MDNNEQSPEQQVVALQEELNKLKRAYSRLNSDYKRAGMMYKTAERMRDVNEAEKELQYFYNHLLLQTGDDLFLVLDKQLHLVLATRTSLAFFGVEKLGDVVNQPLLPLLKKFLDEDAQYLIRQCNLAIATSIQSAYIKRCMLTDGSEITLDCRISPAIDKNGELHGLVIVLHDVTELYNAKEQAERAKEQAERASLTKGLFLANMSHEIRTPMNAIKGMSDLLIHTGLKDTQYHYAKSLSRAANSLLTIINDILDFSKIDANKMEITPDSYDFRAMIADVEKMMQLRATEKHLDFFVEIDEAIPHMLIGDEVRIKQILINLLGNAVKFTHMGHVKLKVSQLSLEADGRIFIAFDVEDTGPGIKEEDIPYLFTAFSQMDAKKHKGIQGTGLGLTITRRLAELMGGSVELKSEYGRGSTFTCLLLQMVDAEAIKTTENYHTEDSFLGSFKAPEAKVLIVDDNEINLIVAAELLKQYDIQADKAMSGMEALDILEKKRYDLIFMDHMMPDMDGIETSVNIRAYADWRHNVPIVALTANAISGMKELFLSSGLNDFLSKPIELAALNTILKTWLPSEKIK
ncbi:MAG: response regulator [Deferribacteraceae bacterium]|jgi:signal transduction histidine kinase/ActR/RegA family two-component response regulator|nr:response regulator [Deferribacteraceae bacterium]